jgi:hypothetical protein
MTSGGSNALRQSVQYYGAPGEMAQGPTEVAAHRGEFRAMIETLRMKRSIRNSMLVCLPFFIAVGIASVWVFLFDPKGPHSLSVALVMGAFWSFWVVACLWCLLAYWKYRLIVEGDRVTKVGIFTRNELWLGDVAEARWRTWPRGGSLVLKSFDCRMAIDFNEYTDEQRDALVRHFRANLDPAVQTGWMLFAYQVTSGETKEREPQEGDVVIDRRRWDRFFLRMLPLFMATGAYLAWQADRWGFLFVPLVPLAFLWVPLRFATPAKGLTCQPLSKEEWAPGQLRMFSAIGLSILAMPAIKWMIPERGSQDTAIGILAAGLSAYMIVEVFRTDRWVRRRVAEKAEAAALARGEQPSTSDAFRL